MSKAKVRKFYVQGYPVLVDAADWDIVMNWPYAWRVVKDCRTHYVESSDWSEGKHRGKKLVRLHRLLTGARSGEEVYHLNNRGLDNRRENLRVGSRLDATQGMRRGNNNTSGFTGVNYCNNHQKWRARLVYAGRSYHLGRFVTREEAALAYNEAVFRILPIHHAELRKLNVIPGDKKYGKSKKAA